MCPVQRGEKTKRAPLGSNKDERVKRSVISIVYVYKHRILYDTHKHLKEYIFI